MSVNDTPVNPAVSSGEDMAQPPAAPTIGDWLASLPRPPTAEETARLAGWLARRQQQDPPVPLSMRLLLAFGILAGVSLVLALLAGANLVETAGSQLLAGGILCLAAIPLWLSSHAKSALAAGATPATAENPSRSQPSPSPLSRLLQRQLALVCLGGGKVFLFIAALSLDMPEKAIPLLLALFLLASLPLRLPLDLFLSTLALSAGLVLSAGSYAEALPLASLSGEVSEEIIHVLLFCLHLLLALLLTGRQGTAMVNRPVVAALVCALLAQSLLPAGNLFWVAPDLIALLQPGDLSPEAILSPLLAGLLSLILASLPLWLLSPPADPVARRSFRLRQGLAAAAAGVCGLVLPPVLSVALALLLTARARREQTLFRAFLALTVLLFAATSVFLFVVSTEAQALSLQDIARRQATSALPFAAGWLILRFLASYRLRAGTAAVAKVAARRWQLRRRLPLLAVLLVLLAGVNSSFLSYRQRAASGEILLLELKPADPRSLLQGDYMQLRYRLEDEIREQLPPLSGNRPLQAVLRREDSGLASLVAVGEVAGSDQALADNERLLPVSPASGRLLPLPDSFFFQQGEARRYAATRYGIFRCQPAGHQAARPLSCLLTGLADESGQEILPPATGKTGSETGEPAEPASSDSSR